MAYCQTLKFGKMPDLQSKMDVFCLLCNQSFIKVNLLNMLTILYCFIFRTVQELERPVMPTFINLPPPYSEQPSPLYNLCASSISSGSNFCEQHLRNAIPNPLANQPCCHHHHFCENSGSDVTSSQSRFLYIRFAIMD